MELNRKIWGIVVIMVLVTSFAKGSHESQMRKPSNQFFPAIYENIVVWEDDRNGDLNIYGYNLLTRKEFQVTTHKGDQLLPAIYNDYVVWQDNRNGNWDIYGCRLFEEGSFQITTNIHDQQSPAIYNDYVVWQDNRNGNWDIYGYNLSTKEEFRITTDIHDQQSPAIYYNDFLVMLSLKLEFLFCLFPGKPPVDLCFLVISHFLPSSYFFL